ncbi:signal peptide peptidase SppA [Kaistella antarctica]|uniref:Protease 4 n=1 Tax=Kaistella antarctica TaxID=266748 RepID=A0A448NUI7_9FLAO|nr:signal peptide peptidase SppA [Kaistella antarctica]KEY18500.1 signal peptide peptidase SppA [Kaistella antarctica]SEV86349.1 protease-4 [Kaistella antarctica]VEI01295.1 Protease 4 [Kaistella antarctica]
MRSFFKNVLANIVAIIIIAAVFSLFLIMIIASSALSGDQKPSIKSNTVLTLDFKTSIIDSPTEDQGDLFAFNDKQKNVLIFDMLEAIKKAKNDDKIKGISIETDGIRAGFTQLDDIRGALEDFKKSGKFVYAYGNVVSQSAYYLGSVADQYILNPAGGIDLKGLSTEVLYMKNFADKYGIGIEIIRHGKYKAAVEPFMRDDMSPENKDQLSTLLNDVWSSTSKKIAASRKIDSAQFRTVVDSLYGTIPDLSLQNKLADKLMQKSEYDKMIRTKLNLKEKDKLTKVSFKKYINSFSEDASKKNEQIAVLYASGAIYNGEGYKDIFADNYVKEIKKLTEDDKIKAVVLRINSPGGSANASDEILFELQQLKKKKPIIVSFGDYAASGGYYIAMAADKIYSEPNTLTGSIGVFGMIPYFKEIANKNGFTAIPVTTNANSNMYSPINGVTPGGVAILTKSVEQTYKRFVHFVTENRKKSFEQIDEIGGGRVWSGTRAKEIGLVDELGTLQDAIAFAAQKVKLKDYGVTSYPKKMSQFEQIFKNLDEDEISARLIKNKIGADNYKMFDQLTNPKLQEGVMMKMPFDIKIN